jgi:hypothetical protein
MARPKVGEILIRAGLIDEMQLRAALGDQSNWGQRLGVTLVKMGLLEERDLVRALSQQLQLPVVDLEGKRVQSEVLELVPVSFAEKHLCVPLFVKEEASGRTLHVGMDDPCDLEVLDDLEFQTGLKVQAVLVSPSGLCEAIDRLYRRPSDRSLGLSDDFSGARGPVAGVSATPDVHESLFPEVFDLGDADRTQVQESKPEPELELDPDPEPQLELDPDLEFDSRPELEVDPEPQPEQVATDEPPADPAAQPSSDTTRTILRALCHLLIQKEVISREDLYTLVRSLEAEGKG